MRFSKFERFCRAIRHNITTIYFYINKVENLGTIDGMLLVSTQKRFSILEVSITPKVI